MSTLVSWFPFQNLAYFPASCLSISHSWFSFLQSWYLHLAIYLFSGEIRRVEVIVIAGRADEPYRHQYIKSYRLLFSSDGANFAPYQEMPGIDKVMDNNIMLTLPKTHGFVMIICDVTQNVSQILTQAYAQA